MYPRDRQIVDILQLRTWTDQQTSSYNCSRIRELSIQHWPKTTGVIYPRKEEKTVGPRRNRRLSRRKKGEENGRKGFHIQGASVISYSSHTWLIYQSKQVHQYLSQKDWEVGRWLSSSSICKLEMSPLKVSKIMSKNPHEWTPVFWILQQWDEDILTAK